MKKFTPLSFMLVAALLMFSSCSKDDDAPALDATLLQGTWFVGKTVYSEGKDKTTVEDDGTIYNFDNDNTYHILYADSDVEEGTYSLNGHILVLQSEGLSFPYEVKALTSTSLNLYMSAETEIEGEDEPFKYSETIYLSREK